MPSTQLLSVTGPGILTMGSATSFQELVIMGWPPVAGIVGISAGAAFVALSLPLLFTIFFSSEAHLSIVSTKLSRP